MGGNKKSFFFKSLSLELKQPIIGGLQRQAVCGAAQDTGVPPHSPHGPLRCC